ncbi:primary-amine oxidase [Subtercola endophyticus]|uniref:primary-amine oxidase n=1 Tax=Subtercola endophyticus TaxID=2895559 RepID=UPI001E3B9F03|nr:primary-amine oxidase [Subtercola endophyticus]UFS58603.1 primary-amine oxidase [Subtercola endophyticus]
MSEPTSEVHAGHPLALLEASDIDVLRVTAAEAGLLMPSTRFAYVGLVEPSKAELRAFEAGTPGAVVGRMIAAVLLERATGIGTVIEVDVTTSTLVSQRTINPVTEGQPGILDEEFAEVEGWLLASDEWRAALGRRGIDPERVRAVPLSAGNFGRPNEEGRRLCRVLGFLQLDEHDLPWAHPIDGVVAHVDMTTGEVFEVVDSEVLPVPEQRGEWNAPPFGKPARTDLKPIEISQPEGPSFTIEGNKIQWADWELRFGFDVREGMILHQVGFREGEALRPVLHRASIPEMVVPYGDPAPARFWINYFDQGEYIFGRYTNSLELGCDCLGDITYVDVTVADETGNPRLITNAICIHEEDFGVLWKHTDLFNGMNETRRQRRLVISFFVTIGNYDYGFYWYLSLDGTIQLEAKATGVVFTSAYRPGGYTTHMAPGLGASYHQHLFSARLDFAVDGDRNVVDEVDAVRVPRGPGNEHGNAFRPQRTRLTSELTACRDADNLKFRHWIVSNPDKQNYVGENVAYGLFPQGMPALLADPSSTIANRASFAQHHLWVTQYDKTQRWSAGEFPNQSPGNEGLLGYTAGDRPLDGEDVVLWHTFGLTHFPRTEDWPIMPVDYAGFTLKPVGFFDFNPALNAPEAGGSHAHHGHGAGHGHPHP